MFFYFKIPNFSLKGKNISILPDLGNNVITATTGIAEF